MTYPGGVDSGTDIFLCTYATSKPEKIYQQNEEHVEDSLNLAFNCFKLRINLSFKERMEPLLSVVAVSHGILENTLALISYQNSHAAT